MEGTTAAAGGSLAGLVASLLLYTRFPLSGNGLRWETIGPWISVLLLVVGLVCFVVLLITGLITVLNWINDRPADPPRRT